MRFYAISWRDGGRPCAIDLVGAPEGRKGELVGRLAEAVKSFGSGARTDLVAAPGAGACLARLGDYLWADLEFNGVRLQRHLRALRADEEPHLFTLRTGVPAEGGDLVGREAPLADARRRLEAGTSLHLMAPRRYGKTSFLRRLARDLRSSGRRVVVIDAENLATVGAFAVALAEQALRDGMESLRALPELRGWPLPDASAAVRLAAKEALRASLGAVPVAFLKQVLRVLGGEGVVLCIDEFSRFLLNCPRADVARGMSAFHEARVDGGPTTIVAGSSGLRSFIASTAMSGAFDDLGVLSLEPLEQESAGVLVEELLYGHGRPPTPIVVAAVLERLGAPVPYFLQALVHHTLAEAQGALDISAVDRAYRNRLLDVEGNEFFRPFRLQERGYRDAWRGPAARILARLARSETPVPVAELRALCPDDFATLIAALSEDYDIVESDGAASLRSKVLRERWALRESWLTGD